MKREYLVYGGLVLLTILLMILDPIRLDPDKISWISALYAIIPLGIWYFFFRPKPVQIKSLTVTSDDVTKEKIKSLIRTAIQLLGILIVVLTAVGVNIPILNKVADLMQYLSGQVDIAYEAVMTLIGIGIAIYGFFKNSDRFAVRAIK